MGPGDAVKYLTPESPFFERPFSLKQHYFTLPLLDSLDKRYHIDEGEVWKQYSADRHFPEQGWKIHIGSTPLNCGETLNIAAQVCCEKDVTFKFLKSREVFFAQHAKYADRPQAGKFITIYPKDDKEFCRLLDILSEKLRGMPSPPILTDINVPGTPVFFRYGGFQYMECSGRRGFKVPAIKNDKDELIPDIRSTKFEIPAFVTPPDTIRKLVQNCLHPSDNLLSELINGYEVKHALHFSNAGGVYLLEDSKDKTYVVMKEGRNLIGFDSSGNDGRARIEHEYAILQSLHSLNGVVETIKLSHSGGNAYLFEKYVPGVNLYKWESQNYPFATSTNSGEYEKKALYIIDQLCQVVDEVHSRGIYLCDLQPRNIMINDELHLTLIDTESSVATNDPNDISLGTPGFMPHTKCSPAETDRYSLMQTAMHLFVPVVPTQGLTDSYWANEMNFVKHNFSVKAVQLLCSLRSKVDPSTIESGSTVKASIIDCSISDHLSDLRDRLIMGLHASRKNNSPLYHGDFIQFENKQAQFDIENGLAGVMYALGPDDENAKEDLAFLKQNATASIFSDFGLYRGALGVACVLSERGETSAAEDILTSFMQHGGPSKDNISIRTGLAGQYLALRHMLSLPHGDITSEAYQKTFELLTTFDKERLQSAILYGVSNVNGSGLFDGYSGMAVALSLAAHDAESPQLSIQAQDALDLELDNLESASDGSIQMLDVDRFLPYLAEGSGGVAIAIKQIDPGLKNRSNAKLITQILKGCDVRLCVNGGLFYGYSGLLGVLEEIGQIGEIDNNWDTLPLYLFKDKDNRQLFVGDGGRAMSCSYSAGSSGLLALLNYLTGSATSWIYGLTASRQIQHKI